MTRLLGFLRKRVILVTVLLLLLFSIPVAFEYLASYVEGAAFHKALERSTSHGLHMEAHWDQIEHTGIFGLASDAFHGENGERALKSIDAQKITATFDPTGILYGRWDLDDIVVDSAEVRLQKVNGAQGNAAQSPATNPASPTSPSPTSSGSTISTNSPAQNVAPTEPSPAPSPNPVTTNTALPTETPPVPEQASQSAVPAAPSGSNSTPTPGPSPTPDAPVPWYAAWLPHRVSLRHVLIKEGNLISTFRGQDGGIYGSEVVMTPNDRDYEYDFHDGEMRLPSLPVLHLSHLHALVTKPLLSVSELLLDEGPETPDHLLRIEGTVGLKDDKSVHATINWNNLSIEKWLPPTFQPRLTGLMKGNIDYASPGFVVADATAKGNLEFDGVTLPALGFVKQYSQYTGSPNPGAMPLKQAQTDVSLASGTVTFTNLAIESEGVFRLEGTISVNMNHEINGNVQLGLADPYLRWLPSAKQRIFTDQRLGYSFANVHVSGTMENPKEDLSGRVFDEVKHNPFLAFKLLFHKIAH